MEIAPKEPQLWLPFADSGKMKSAPKRISKIP